MTTRQAQAIIEQLKEIQDAESKLRDILYSDNPLIKTDGNLLELKIKANIRDNDIFNTIQKIKNNIEIEEYEIDTEEEEGAF
jgi:hypothetical protein